MRIPRPETRRAWLTNDRGDWTLHTYDHAVLASDGLALLYRCTETGVLRVWGYERI